jgi:hypothetical protein
MNIRLLAIAFLCCVWSIQAQEAHFTVTLNGHGPSGSGVLTLNSNILTFNITLPGIGPWELSAAGPGMDPRRPRFRLRLGSCPDTPNPPDSACVVEGAIVVTDTQISEMLDGLWVAYADLTIFRRDPNHTASRYVLTGQIVPVDTDDDGVPDYRDACPDTPVGAVVDVNGCGIEQLCPCEGPWENHGQYVKQVRAVTATFLADGLITVSEQRAIIGEAAKSDCGKAPRSTNHVRRR